MMINSVMCAVLERIPPLVMSKTISSTIEGNLLCGVPLPKPRLLTSSMAYVRHSFLPIDSFNVSDKVKAVCVLGVKESVCQGWVVD